MNAINKNNGRVCHRLAIYMSLDDSILLFATV